MTKQIHVRVPATSANIGSGFDAVGIALNFFDDFYFTEDAAKTHIDIEIEGLGKDSIPTDFSENFVGRAMKAVAIKNKGSLPKGGTLKLVNAIPPR